MFFSIPGIESLHSVHDPNTSNPGWSVNGQNTIVAFKQLLSMNAVAHEFGHALGLKHTFTEESKVTKIKEETVVKEDGFYERINNKIKGVNSYFITDSKYYQVLWTTYKGYYTVISGIDSFLKDIYLQANIEIDMVQNTTHIDNNKLINEQIVEKESVFINKKQTIENFMDYVSDTERKSLSIEQINTIKKIYED